MVVVVHAQPDAADVAAAALVLVDAGRADDPSFEHRHDAGMSFGDLFQPFAGRVPALERQP
jgi:hypothetical protein